MRQTQIMGKTMTIILVEIANKYGHDINQSDNKTPVEVFFE